MGNVGRIDPGGDTHKWLDAENAPRWMQMPPGSAAGGYHNHAHFEVKPPARIDPS